MADLRLNGLTKSFGGPPVLQGLDLDVTDGELLVLVGPSGSGKTTALRVIAGLEDADAGSVAIGGRDATALAPEQRNVGMVFQTGALFPHKRVRDNIGYGLLARGHPAADVARRVQDVAALLRIDALLDRLPRALSGGERQRVALARALVREPDVLLMDEPLSALDAQLRVELRAEIARLQKTSGTTTVYVTHDQAEALALGDRIAVLNDGALEQVGAPQAVYDRPDSVFVARFLGSPPMNVLHRGGTLACVRPENVHVRGSRWAPAEPSGRELLAAVAELVEPAGDHSVLTLRAGEDRVLARVEPGFAPEPGTPLTVWFDAGAIHRFGADGRRL